MNGNEARESIAKANKLADNGNTDEAIRLLAGVLLSLVDAADPDVEALIEKQRDDGQAFNGTEWVPEPKPIAKPVSKPISKKRR